VFNDCFVCKFSGEYDIERILKISLEDQTVFSEVLSKNVVA